MESWAGREGACPDGTAPSLRASFTPTPSGQSCSHPPKRPFSLTWTPGPLRTKKRCLLHNQGCMGLGWDPGHKPGGTALGSGPTPPQSGGRLEGHVLVVEWGCSGPSQMGGGGEQDAPSSPLSPQLVPTSHRLCLRMKSGAGGGEKARWRQTKGGPKGSPGPAQPQPPALHSPYSPFPSAGQEPERGCSLGRGGMAPGWKPEGNLVSDLHPRAWRCLATAEVSGVHRGGHPGESRGTMGGGRGTARTGTSTGPPRSSGVPAGLSRICWGGSPGNGRAFISGGGDGARPDLRLRAGRLAGARKPRSPGTTGSPRGHWPRRWAHLHLGRAVRPLGSVTDRMSPPRGPSPCPASSSTADTSARPSARGGGGGQAGAGAPAEASAREGSGSLRTRAKGSTSRALRPGPAGSLCRRGQARSSVGPGPGPAGSGRTCCSEPRVGTAAGPRRCLCCRRPPASAPAPAPARAPRSAAARGGGARSAGRAGAGGGAEGGAGAGRRAGERKARPQNRAGGRAARLPSVKGAECEGRPHLCAALMGQ